MTARALTQVLALSMALGAIVSWGCASADLASSVPFGECQATDQCEIGFVCASNQCVNAAQVLGPEEVAVEVVPPPGSPYTRLHRLDVSLKNTARTLTLRLPVPIAYEVVVLDAKGERVDTELAVYGADRIPGRELEHSAIIDADGQFGAKFPLIEGTYSARLRPLDAETPGIDVESFSVRQGGVLPKEFRIPEQYRRLSGRVSVAQASDEPYEGAIVRAIGEKSLLESTVGVSDVDGRYELLLPDTNDTVFRVNAVLPQTEQPAWAYAESILVEPGGDRSLDIHIERSSMENRGAAAIQIIGVRRDGTGEAIVNARVTLTASVSDRFAPPVYKISGTTDADGQLLVDFDGELVSAVPLLRALYIVDVVPPARSAFGGSRSVLDFRSAGTNFTLDEQVQLSERTHLAGDIASDLGRPVVARVELIPLEENSRARDTESDTNGRFELDVDPGDYLMIVRPRNSTGIGGERLPVGIQRVTVSNEPTYVLAPFRLPPGSVSSGIVQGELADEPIVGADVEMFVREEGLTISLGRTITNDAGALEVVLPIPQ